MSDSYPMLPPHKLALMKLVLHYHDDPEDFLNRWHESEARRALLKEVGPDDDTLVDLIEEEISRLLISQVNIDAEAAKHFQELKGAGGSRYTGIRIFVKEIKPNTFLVGELVEMDITILMDSGAILTGVEIGLTPDTGARPQQFVTLQLPQGMKLEERALKVRTVFSTAGKYTVSAIACLEGDRHEDYLPEALTVELPEASAVEE